METGVHAPIHPAPGVDDEDLTNGYLAAQRAYKKNGCELGEREILGLFPEASRVRINREVKRLQKGADPATLSRVQLKMMALMRMVEGMLTYIFMLSVSFYRSL